MVEEDRGLDSVVSSRFGRAPLIVIVDLEGSEVRGIRTVENPGARAGSGAAIRAVQKLVDEGVQAVAAGAFGPNAMTALEEVGIRRIQVSGVPVSEALRSL